MQYFVKKSGFLKDSLYKLIVVVNCKEGQGYTWSDGSCHHPPDSYCYVHEQHNGLLTQMIGEPEDGTHYRHSISFALSV